MDTTLANRLVLSTLPDDPMKVAWAACGLPFTGVELKLVDPQPREPVADGAEGLLMTRGHKLLGYLGVDSAGAWPMTSSGKVAEHELVRRPQANS